MPNTILNDPAASNNAAAYPSQARPDKGDIDVWTAGHSGIGVISGGVVTPGTGMAVNVTAVQFAVAPAGAYKLDSFGAAANLAVSAADPTNDRVDLVVATDVTGPAVVTGAALPGTPAWPTIPANSVVLALLAIPHGSSSITTAMIVDKRVVLPAPYNVRQTGQHTTASLAALAVEQSSIVLAKSYRLLNVTTTVAARVRLYDRAAKQSADASRAIGTAPTGDHGLMYEFVGSGSLLSMDTTPPVFGSSMEATPVTSIPLTVDNLSGGTTAITVTLTFFALE